MYNEQKIMIELGYNKCLFEKGELDEALKNSKKLVDLLHLDNINKNNIYHKISDKLKGKIYGDYSLYIEYKLINRINNIIKPTLKKKNDFYLTKVNDSHSPQLIHKNTIMLNNNKFSKNFKKRELLLSYSKTNPHESSFNHLFQSKLFKNNSKEVNNINYYLMLATKYYSKKYKYWDNYAILNYGCYKYIHNRRIKSNDKFVEDYEKKVKLSLTLEVNYAKNALKGIKNCLGLTGNNLDKSYQNCIRLIDIFFNIGGENDELLSLITSIFHEYNSKIFLQILPLLISRLGNKNIKILEILVKILVEICEKFPYDSLIPLIINKFSNSIKRKSIANQILYLVEKKNPNLKIVINDYKLFINQLNKCSLLLHEIWKEAIEEASKMLVSKNYNGLIKVLKKVHDKMNEFPDNLYEIHFNQYFYYELKGAENYLKKYIKNPNERYIKEAWEIYQTVYNNIMEKYKNMSTISLEYISPLLSNIKENQISLPGYYFLDKLYKERKQLIIGKTKNKAFDNEDLPVFLKKMDKYLYVLNTKQKPRKISLIGTDNKEYKYLLKSHEDLRQDERIIQVFNYTNSILSLDKGTSSKKLLTLYQSFIKIWFKTYFT